MSDDDLLTFAPETTTEPPPRERWRVLVIDDDEEVQLVTALTLKGLLIEGRGVELVSAGSLRAAQQALLAGPEFAVALIDVVMETPTAGLELARWIRATLHDRDVRLLLRTGQPGGVAELDVTEDYDIHDYLAKTEITGRVLTTRVAGAVRAWRDLVRVRAEARVLRYLLSRPGADAAELCAGATSLLLTPRGRVVHGGSEGLPLVSGWRYEPAAPDLSIVERVRLDVLHEELVARGG